jgi:hypothetical protein
MTAWVADAGPLIFLAKLNRLNLLQESGETIYTPVAVMAEIKAKADEASSKIEEASNTGCRSEKSGRAVKSSFC